ncbi:MAG: glycosyl transferase [Flavobacterium sp. BFFFF1]|uniref:transglycosylase domain-containing protein n=1 Tax=Flavobacterium sp. BFFFF1 TaxID=2015557 RepID=UPI000BCC65B7|nr:biosynthetic peptidoglycan transglycosylase [Flavobacterium sp. BFFFF1]OYU82315.1 MAG: glycosyl transferase [Flavobacterium sp. BFFFF1]
MRTGKQKIYLALKIIAVFFVMIVVGFFIFRNTLLEKAIARVSNKMDREYNSTFKVRNAAFEGFSGIRMEEVSLVPKNADTLLNIKKVRTSVNFWKLMFGEVQLGTLELHDGFVQLVKRGETKNFDAFLKKKSENDLPSEKRDYAEWAYRLISQGLNLIPTDMQLTNLAFRLNDNGKTANILFSKLSLADKQLETSINVRTTNFSQNWRLAGFADPRHNKADIRFFNIDTGAIKIPYLDERYHFKSSFDSIRVKVDDIDMDGDELHVDGFASIANLKINHRRIASKDVTIKNARFDYRFLLGENFISIDSASTVSLNKLKFHPYVSYDTESDTVYKLKVNIPKMKAQDFISSLPDGLFSHLQGMEAEGNFSYNLDFMFNKNKPGALVFDSKLEKEGLKILKYGDANLSKLNGEFIYHAIENGREQRGILVGPGNPNYTPLSQISPYLRKSVLTTEDPSFFSHRGFISEAFKQSIIKNIRTKKFSRGASTISMQLIKNVFLTREKTLSRKLEEILLVYTLENNRISSKERMLEVYFNIIEWGPNVYGIGEASRFYFQKSPSELSLNECLYLATIIPSPKHFMWQFDGDGNLKSYAKKNQTNLTNLMLRRGVLIAEDTLYKSLPVLISGPAKSFIRLKVKDTTVVDSLRIDEEFEF